MNPLIPQHPHSFQPMTLVIAAVILLVAFLILRVSTPRPKPTTHMHNPNDLIPTKELLLKWIYSCRTALDLDAVTATIDNLIIERFSFSADPDHIDQVIAELNRALNHQWKAVRTRVFETVA